MIVSENDVVIATAVWLAERGVRTTHACLITPVSGNRYDDQRRLREALTTAGVDATNLRCATDGADIVAVSDREYWQVECKGTGSGVQSTQRNNFDRALASAVSCFASREEIGDHCAGRTPLLALALPASKDYMGHIRRRIRPSLRRSLNMWLVLCDPSTLEVRAVAPEDELPALAGT